MIEESLTQQALDASGVFTCLVHGDPIPWKRAGKSGKRHFTRGADKAWRDKVRLVCRAAMGARKWDASGWCRVHLSFRFADDGRIGMVDIDNLIKSILDALGGTRAKAATAGTPAGLTSAGKKRYARPGKPARAAQGGLLWNTDARVQLDGALKAYADAPGVFITAARIDAPQRTTRMRLAAVQTEAEARTKRNASARAKRATRAK